MSFSIRIYRDADFAGVLPTIHAATRADDEFYLPSEADLRARLSTPHAAPHIDAMQDVFVAEAPEIGIVAYADGVLSEVPGAWLYRTQRFIRPDFRRQGIGRALLERQWARTRELSTQLDGQTVILGARARDTRKDALALFENFSMRPVRHFLEMNRDWSTPIPALELPPGLQLLTWVERPDDRAVWAASEEAFADHWRHSPEPFDVFEHRVNSGRLDREYSYIAWDGSEIAGGALNEMGPAAATRRGDNRSWIGILFVRQPWRKRGLGRALLSASLLKAREMGHASVGLNVDAENPTGAVRLYESVGFTVAARFVAYERAYPEKNREKAPA